VVAVAQVLLVLLEVIAHKAVLVVLVVLELPHP
jgi:hypothetical protein